MVARPLLTPLRRRAIAHGLLVAGWLFIPVWAITSGEFGHDSFAYWSFDRAAPYAGQLGDSGFFLPYSPPIALLFSPFALLPWPVFVVTWWVIALAALAFVAGSPRMFAILLAFPFVAVELTGGNIHLLLAAAIVAGFRWPVAWSFVLLTKVTPGIGLLWFAVRREWRPLVIALGATATIAGLAYIIVPGFWAEWIGVLSGGYDRPYVLPQLIPLPVRVAAAAVLVSWGALANRRWVLPVAALIALPGPWMSSWSLLVAIPALASSREGPHPERGTSGARTPLDQPRRGVPSGREAGAAVRDGTG
jgi:hypothetical protein